MTFRVVLFAYRKAGLTPQEFKHRYETVHVPLIKEIAGSLFPLSHTRRYISRQETTPDGSQAEAVHAAELVSGDAADVMYDAITEMTFDTREDFYRFAGILNEPGNAAKIQSDCAGFLDTTKVPTMLVLQDVCETYREGWSRPQ
jgi:uncharacterized protein (TIGR02118 family)